MEIISKLDRNALISDLKSDSCIRSHILVCSYHKRNFIVHALYQQLVNDSDIVCNIRDGSFRHTGFKSILSISCYDPLYDETICQTVYGRVLDKIYIDRMQNNKIFHFLQSRFRRSNDLPDIKDNIGIYVFKDL